MKALIVAALLLAPSVAQAQAIKPLIVTLSLLRTTDALLTRDLSHRYGGHELNPFMPQSTRGILALMAGETIAQTYVLSKLSTTHPKLARVIAWGSIGVEGWVIHHNARQYR